MSCFNNCNPKTNGEQRYISLLSPGKVIFDVGSRNDSDFMSYNGEVHYFDPVERFVNELKDKPTRNTKQFFNAFGLSDAEKEITYFPKYQSFYNRITTCHVDDSENAITLNVRKACDYIIENSITHIDLVKIDTEGHELNVILGFGESIDIVDKIQFEYGGTYIDTGIKLKDVIDYLISKRFNRFSYIAPDGLREIMSYEDHYRYCNILAEKI